MRLVLIALLLAGCPKKKVIRDAATFRLEVEAALARQLEAAEALRDAASAASDRGDFDACVRYAEPALLIEASAAIQAKRALYLAELESEDPGPSQPIADVSTICGDPQ